MALSSFRLHGIFTLRSPLSHIGETISASSHLAQDQILQPDGELTPVFAYSGNAWRGQLRDLSAAYMLDAIGSPRVGLDAFHLLFSGGAIGGAQNTDIAQARRMRAAMPHLAVFGGGVGNQILEGKLRVGSSYPICQEAIPVLPPRLHDEARKFAYADCTFEKEYSRRDDAKIESVRRHLNDDPEMTLLDAPKKGKKTAATDDVPTQMRIRSELVCPGVRLYSWITVHDVSLEQMGCLIAALHSFSRSPHIGGQASRGHGLVDVAYEFEDLSSGEVHDLIKIEDGRSLLAPKAVEAKAAYDEHLRNLYDQLLANNEDSIKTLLGAA
ncbi:hypothetical protein APY04_0805 [Hyphomicrobium sulfonivorans]|uniref:DUF324 domain-containing protein n=1 Tax=Hyphomicrobium sulfonivorans TaxID=121290 RepID=A0A109BKZ4_HYPSL|nr:hypothetical protein [Hyphomicrobium sulfonivorans]KWT70744.1 hypothetical protein APY04_0805 [Hyphomicrobium sulfonivorans]